MEAFPALGFLIFILMVPESPRWLIVKKGDVENARETLKVIDSSNVEQQIRAIQASAHVGEGQVKELFFSKKYSLPIMLAVLFATFNQVSGINAIIYYAPRIFEMTGLGTDGALLSIPVILLTARDADQQKAEGMQTGAELILPPLLKPYTIFPLRSIGSKFD